MEEKNRYYVVTKKAVPEVLLKVVEAKRLLESAKASTVQEAADMVGISRSSFYKYKDDIFLYIQKYYRFFMKDRAGEVPVFEIHMK